MIIKIAKQIAARGMNIASSFLCAIIIGEKFGSQAFAEYAFSISFINIFSAICLLGFEITIGKEYFSNSFTRRKKIYGAITVAVTFFISYTILLALSKYFERNFSSTFLLAASLVTSITFYLTNFIKYEGSIHVFEFIRGGGINTVCLILLIATPISKFEIENHAIVLFSSIGIFFICAFSLALTHNRPQESSNSTTLAFISNSISLSLTALISSLIVSGDLIISKFILPQESYENMALLTRVSFLLAIPFVILNNNYAVEITQRKDSWPIPKKLLINLVISTVICTTILTLSDKYLSLFSSNYDKTLTTPIIYLIVISHAMNITSSGFIPYLACHSKNYLNAALAITIPYTIIAYTHIESSKAASPELKFSLVFYSSLFFFKLTIVLFSIFNFSRSRTISQ